MERERVMASEIVASEEAMTRETAVMAEMEKHH